MNNEFKNFPTAGQVQIQVQKAHAWNQRNEKLKKELKQDAQRLGLTWDEYRAEKNIPAHIG